jgi:hypothetical protein
MATPEIENFVKLFNGKIKGYEDTLAMRKGRTNNDSEPDPSGSDEE